MNIVPSIPIKPEMVTSINLVDSADYDAGTTYGTGDVVKDPATLAEYQSVIDNNLGNDPTADNGSKWLQLGYANSHRLFDGFLGGQSENPDAIIAELTVGDAFTSVALFNLQGASATLVILEDEVEVFSQTISLVRTDEVGNLWDYFFTKPQNKQVALFTSVPGFPSSKVRITIAAQGGTAKVGEVIFGYRHTLGETLEGSGPQLTDYSVKEANDFGEFRVVQRPYSKGATYYLGLDPQETDRVFEILARNRSRTCVFFPGEGMEHYGMTVVGFFTEFAPSLEHRGKVTVTIPIEGIT